MSINLEITIQRRVGEAWPVIAERSRTGSFLPVRQEGQLHLDLARLEKTVDRREYGELLGKALFRGEVHEAFTAALSEARSQEDDYLRVLLFIEAEDLKILHWQRLCARLDRRWEFLALQQQTPFSLYLPSQTDRRFPPFGRRDLRALVLAANPTDLQDYDLAPFDETSTVASLTKALGEIPTTVLGASPGSTGPATLEALCQQLTTSRYTLLHIVCHGRISEGETVLYLSDVDGMAQPVTATRLIERLGRLSGAVGLPHLAFLSTCESASPQAEAGLGGLGQRLVRELGMPAVVAMSERVSIDTAAALANRFYERLRTHGQADRALSEAAAGLEDRHDITVPALFSRLAGQPLFSQDLGRPLTSAEIAYGLERLQKLLAQRAPILLEEFKPVQIRLSSAAQAEPAALSPEAQRERQQALAQAEELCNEAADLSFIALAQGQEPPLYDGRCPFRGLYPFRAEDREFFFGREALVKKLVERLADHPFLALLGPSGSGKSSLALAGLVPALGQDLPGSRLAYLTPGAEPLARLHTALDQAVDSQSTLLVDQFEELFTLCKDDAQRQAFIAKLLDLAQSQNDAPPKAIILTMRADFWGECAAYPALRAAMQAHQELVAPMDAAELRRAMELQAKQVGLRFEGGLTNTILDDIGIRPGSLALGEPGAMPLMQHALLLLWERRRGRWLRAEEYHATGGVRASIAHTADQVYAGLAEHEKERLRDIFVRLTRLDERVSAGEERRDTRRRAGLDELTPAGSQPAETRALLKRLADARLIVTGLNPTSGREEVEVAHEALIRYWPRLRAWLDEDDVSIRLRDGVREAAQDWQAQQRDEALLVHRAGRLEEALALSHQARYSLNKLELAYLEACQTLRERERQEKEAQQRRELEAARQLAAEQQARADEQERSAQRLRQRALGLAGALVVAILLAISTFYFLRQANLNARDANQQRQTAEFNAGVALNNAATATVAQGQAELQQATAEYNAQIAAQNAAEAQRQATISLSRQLAAQSLASLLAGKDDLAMLLAAQAQRLTDTVQSRGALLTALQDNPRLRLILTGHPDYVISIAYSPDGKTLASSGCHQFDRARENCLVGEVRLWETATGQLRAGPLLEHKNLVSKVAFSPDGQLLVSADASGVILVREATSGAPTGMQLEGHTERVNTLVFTGDSQRLFSFDAGRTFLQWDLASGAPIGLPILYGTNTVLAADREGKLLVTADEGEPIDIREPATGNQIRSIPAPDDLTVGLAIRPDGVLVGSQERLGAHRLVYWSPDGIYLGETELEYAPSDLLFNLAGDELAYTQNDQSIHFLTLVGTIYTPVPPLQSGHSDIITELSFSPDGRYLASASRDKTIRIWDWGGPTTFGQPLAETPPMLYSTDGRLAAKARCREKSGDNCKQGEIILLDAATGKALGEPLVGHTDLITNLAFSPDSRLLASGGWDSTIILWDIASRQALGALLDGHADFVTGLAFSPDGARLVSSSRDGFLVVWDVANHAELVRLRGHGGERALCVDNSLDGRYIVSGGVDNQVVLWDVSASQPVSQTLSGHTNQVNSVIFSPDSHYLASAGSDSQVFLWDLAAGTPSRKSLEGHTQRVNQLAFSPDGRLLASGSWDSQVILWDTATGQIVGEALKGHTNRISGLSFIPGTSTLLTTDQDGKAFAWDLDVQHWAERACAVAARNLSQAEGELFLPGQTYQPTCP